MINVDLINEPKYIRRRHILGRLACYSAAGSRRLSGFKPDLMHADLYYHTRFRRPRAKVSISINNSRIGEPNMLPRNASNATVHAPGRTPATGVVLLIAFGLLAVIGLARTS